MCSFDSFASHMFVVYVSDETLFNPEDDSRATVCRMCDGTGSIEGSHYEATLEYWTWRLSEQLGVDRETLDMWRALYRTNEFRRAQALHLVNKVAKRENETSEKNRHNASR